MIFCIVGPSCAGKTTTCEYIENELGVPFIEGSDVVWKRYNKSSFSGDVMDFVKGEYKEKGKDTFARPVIDLAEELKSTNKVLCGFRTAEEIEFLIDYYGEEVFVIGVHANSLLRFQRKRKRDKQSEFSYEEFVIKDFAEFQFGIATIMEDHLDHLIINEGTFDDLFVNINELVKPTVE